MADAHDLMWDFAYQQGWSQATQLMLALDFIEEHGDNKDFATFLLDVALAAEDELEDGL